MYKIIKDSLQAGATRAPKGSGRRRVTVKCDECGYENTILYRTFVTHGGRCKRCEARRSASKSALGESQSFNRKGSPEWVSWHNMIQRCRDPKCQNHKYYYDKGIKVCRRWIGKDGYANFLHDMGRKPDFTYTIDRIDSDGDYTPENCRWASKRQQVINRRNSIIIEENGIVDTAEGWSRRLGIASTSVVRHYKLGIPLGAVLINRKRGWHGDEVEGVDYYIKPYKESL